MPVVVELSSNFSFEKLGGCRFEAESTDIMSSAVQVMTVTATVFLRYLHRRPILGANDYGLERAQTNFRRSVSGVELMCFNFKTLPGAFRLVWRWCFRSSASATTSVRSITTHSRRHFPRKTCAQPGTLPVTVHTRALLRDCSVSCLWASIEASKRRLPAKTTSHGSAPPCPQTHVCTNVKTEQSWYVHTADGAFHVRTQVTAQPLFELVGTSLRGHQ